MMLNSDDPGHQVRLLHSMLEATSTGFFLLDEQHRVMLFNRAAPAVYKKGTEGELYTGLDLVSHIIDERKDTVRNAIDKAFRGGVTEYEIKHPNPARGWIKVRYSPASFAGMPTGV